MRQFDTMFATMGNLPQAMDWAITDTLRQRPAAIVAEAGPFVALGLIGFIATGARWYLAAVAAAAGMGALRLLQTYAYARRPPSATPLFWARRFRATAWGLGAMWGGWSAVLVLEPRAPLIAMVVGTQAACLLTSVVRHSRVRGLATGQACLTLPSVALACILAPDDLLRAYAPLVGLQLIGTIALIDGLHSQAQRIIHMDAEKSVLLAQLDIAIEQHDDANQRLEALAATDALTGVANRRAFDQAAQAEWRRGARLDQPLSMLLLDVDHFKTYNDAYGHQAGDACLQAVVEAIGSVVQRSGDLIARYGGEEFAVILPATGAAAAGELAERILDAIFARSLPHAANPRGFVTVSIGVATAQASEEGSVTALTAAADNALYAAKRSGRARLVHAEMEAG